MLNLIHQFTQNWNKFFTNPIYELNQNRWTAVEQTMVFTIALIALLITIGWTIKNYWHQHHLNQQLRQYQRQLAQTDDTSQQHLLQNKIKNRQNEIQDTLFSNDTPILYVCSASVFTYIIAGMGTILAMMAFCIVYLGLFSIVTQFIQHLNNHTLPIMTIVTFMLAVIPLIIAIHRNKPQWLKLIIVISELILWFSFIFELIG